MAIVTDTVLKTYFNAGDVPVEGNYVDLIDSKQSINVTFNTQTGTSYTISATDAGKVLLFTNSGSITVTLPDGLDTGFICLIRKKGTGDITLSASTTLESAGTAITTQHTGCVVMHEGSNVWSAMGSLS